MGGSEPVSIAPLPMALRWLNEPVDWTVDGSGLEIESGPKTDLFVDPAGTVVVLNGQALVGEAPAGDFLFSARVAAPLASTFDAGVLLAYRDPGHWAKLCLERSPQGEPTIVSVVTRGVSDDCNSFVCPGGEARLRITRFGGCLALHASAEDGFWRLVRYFTLGGEGALEIGFLAQSPTGEGCRVRFDEIAFERRTLSDIRNGE